jgi:lipopolysaccharide biosynthesis glycosyltransferase
MDSCIVYTTDASYMFPTLVSAMQARQYTSVAKADVIIFCVDLDGQTEDAFAEVCAQEGILLRPVKRNVIEGQTAMLARLFLDRFVPDEYQQCLYLDSDVHIRRSLDPLIDMRVPAGQFLAANDPMTFLLADTGWQSRKLGLHLQSIGLSREQSLQYFNSGVLRICRDGWGKIGSDAWEHYQKNDRPSRFPDQDALNLAGADVRLPMSLAWNFPVFMRYSRVEAAINPCIEHFMSSPKPWHGAFPPWTNEAHRPYGSALKLYPSLARYAHGMSLKTRAVYHVQQRGKKLTEMVTWGFSERRSRILAYEAECLRLAASSQLPLNPVLIG